MKKLYILPIAILTSTLLAGCEHKNPILNEDGITDVRQYLFGHSYKIKNVDFYEECRPYLTGKSRPSHSVQEHCDDVIDKIYISLSNRDAFLQASIDDMHDPIFWKRFFKERT